MLPIHHSVSDVVVDIDIKLIYEQCQATTLALDWMTHMEHDDGLLGNLVGLARVVRVCPQPRATLIPVVPVQEDANLLSFSSSPHQVLRTAAPQDQRRSAAERRADEKKPLAKAQAGKRPHEKRERKVPTKQQSRAKARESKGPWPRAPTTRVKKERARKMPRAKTEPRQPQPRVRKGREPTRVSATNESKARTARPRQRPLKNAGGKSKEPKAPKVVSSARARAPLEPPREQVDYEYPEGDEPALSKAFMWPGNLIQTLASQCQDFRDRVQQFGQILVSSCFSGVGTAELAVEAVVHAINAKLGGTGVLRVQAGPAWDVSPHCRHALVMDPHGGCVFSDILSILEPSCRALLERPVYEEVDVSVVSLCGAAPATATSGASVPTEDSDNEDTSSDSSSSSSSSTSSKLNGGGDGAGNTVAPATAAAPAAVQALEECSSTEAPHTPVPAQLLPVPALLPNGPLDLDGWDTLRSALFTKSFQLRRPLALAGKDWQLLGVAKDGEFQEGPDQQEAALLELSTIYGNRKSSPQASVRLVFRRNTVLEEQLAALFELNDDGDVLGLKAHILSTAACQRHGQQCAIVPAGLGAVHLHLAGSPCQDWSLFGKRKGFAGVTVRAFLTWCALMLSTLPHLIVHENVVGFPVSILGRLLGHYYSISHTTIWPGAVSRFPVRRDRSYAILVLRSAGLLARPLSDIHNLGLHLLESSEEQLTSAALFVGRLLQPFEFRLTAQASEWLATYMAKYPERNVFDLSQATVFIQLRAS